MKTRGLFMSARCFQRQPSSLTLPMRRNFSTDALSSFDQTIPRSGWIGSMKYAKYEANPDLIPLWVADTVIKAFLYNIYC